jgi:hypothetical protein
MTNSSNSPDPTDKRFQQWLAILPSHLQERTRTVALSKDSIEQASRAVSVPIVYWTHHAQRVDENPALDVACALACALERPLLVYHGLSSDYRYSSDRHHVFQIQSAKDLQQAYSELGIRYVFHLQTKPYTFTAKACPANRPFDHRGFPWRTDRPLAQTPNVFEASFDTCRRYSLRGADASGGQSP